MSNEHPKITDTHRALARSIDIWIRKDGVSQDFIAGQLAELSAVAPCPNVVSCDEGTQYCGLAESSVAAMRKELAHAREALRTSIPQDVAFARKRDYDAMTARAEAAEARLKRQSTELTLCENRAREEVGAARAEREAAESLASEQSRVMLNAAEAVYARCYQGVMLEEIHNGAHEIINQLRACAEKTPADMGSKLAELEKELTALREAFGLVSTLNPIMIVDVGKPLNMARAVVAYITAERNQLDAFHARIAELEATNATHVRWLSEHAELFKSKDDEIHAKDVRIAELEKVIHDTGRALHLPPNAELPHNIRAEASCFYKRFLAEQDYSRGLLRQIAEQDAELVRLRGFIDRISRASGFPVVENLEQVTDTICKRIKRVDEKQEQQDAGMQRLKDEVTLLTHKVITCGVAASHPDANLTRTGAYAEWDSPQAEYVRKLRSQRDALIAALELMAGCNDVDERLRLLDAAKQGAQPVDSFTDRAKAARECEHVYIHADELAALREDRVRLEHLIRNCLPATCGGHDCVLVLDRKWTGDIQQNCVIGRAAIDAARKSGGAK